MNSRLQVSIVAAILLAFLFWRSRFGYIRDNIAPYTPGTDLTYGRSDEQTVQEDCRMGLNLSDVKRRHKGNDKFDWENKMEQYKAACRLGRDRFKNEGTSDVFNPDKEKCANTKKRDGKQLSGKLCNITGLKRMMPCKGRLKGECCDYWSNCLTQDDIKSTQKVNKWTVYLYQDKDYGGDVLRITETTPNFEWDKAVNLSAFGKWDNKVSSIKIVGKVRVTLYKGSDGAGFAITLSKSEKNLGYYKDYGDDASKQSDMQCVMKLGLIDSNDGCFNDTATSIKVHF